MEDLEEQEYSPENSQDSPSSAMFNDTKTTSTLSSKRSKRSLQKRVVSVPIKEIEGSRLKSEINAPPSDSWAWRKYGQKPIKGSPYPRGYYRCSSSKGCPARKQVERNRADPTMVIVTYSCDHNHPWPASRNNNNHNHHQNSAVSPPPVSTPTITEEEISIIDDQEENLPTLNKQSITEPEFTNLEVGPDGPFIDQYEWFSDLDQSSTLLESPLLAGDIVGDADMAMIFFDQRGRRVFICRSWRVTRMHVRVSTKGNNKRGSASLNDAQFGPVVWDKRVMGILVTNLSFVLYFAYSTPKDA